MPTSACGARTSATVESKLSAAAAAWPSTSVTAASATAGAGPAATVRRDRRLRTGSGANASSKPTQTWFGSTAGSGTTTIVASADDASNVSSGWTWQQFAARPNRSAYRVAASVKRRWRVSFGLRSNQSSPCFTATPTHSAFP